MQSNAATVEEYFGELPPERRAALESLRQLIRSIAPQAEETMRYRMPTYLFGDEMFCAFASQKNYMALYCAPEVVDKHRSKLGELNCGKSCIRFRELEDLPLEAVRSILAEIAALRGK